MNKEIIAIEEVNKTFSADGLPFSALQNINLTIAAGEFVGIVGRSGSGKSTLLNMMSGIDRPTSGSIVVGETNLNKQKQGQLDAWRGKSIGLVFQFFQLIPTLTVVENVMLPMDFCKVIPTKDRLTRALHLLDTVGMASKADKFPAILSGGEKQRVAIARSMANDPPIILGDEPTGNLDTDTAEVVFNLFTHLQNQGKTVVIVSHDSTLEKYTTRTIRLADGKIESITPKTANHV